MKHIYLLLLFISIYSVTVAQDKTYKNEAGFQSDNDGFLGQGSDKYYTAGNFFYFHHALKVAPKDTAKLANKVLGFELGQRIYTPQSGFIPSADYVDRPFAGYLYIQSTLNLLYKNESNLKLQAQLGSTGPHSGGQEIQDLIHSTFGFYKPQGWQYQIRNNFEVNLQGSYNRLLARGYLVDLSLNTYANLGTGLTGAGAGFMFRFGKLNNLFNSISTQSTVTLNNNKSLNNGEIFFYYKPSINLVVYNSTIQGGLFEDKHAGDEITLTKEPFILNQQIGGDFVKGHWVIDLSAVFETREVKEMVGKHHQWGSLSVAYRFN